MASKYMASLIMPHAGNMVKEEEETVKIFSSAVVKPTDSGPCA
jgi:hypothetical protein